MFQIVFYIAVFLSELAVFAKIRSWRTRQVCLLAGSYALYLTWQPWFAAVLLASTLMNFLLGEWVRRKPHWPALSAGIFLNLALLGIFKYLPGIAPALPFSSFQRLANLALPLGISFWTFQAMSYLFDLYRGEELNPSFVEFALYMSFFPVSIAGPICRLPEMLPQFRSDAPVRQSNVEYGLVRVATGVLMMELAKLLGQGVFAGDGINSGFDKLTRWSGADVWCLAFGYGLQLFFDFAGYSHIAIGAAGMLGFRVPENFDRPFESVSPSIFWTRWHMSLSFWIRDYVFLPLAVLRRELWWRNLSLVLAMVLFGIWHKAGVLFVIWGCYHGVLLVLHRQMQQLERRVNWEPPAQVWEPLSWLTTIALVSLGWIFFRATSLTRATHMLSALVQPSTYLSHLLSGSLYLLVLASAAAYVLVLRLAQAFDRYSADPKLLAGGGGLKALLFRKRWLWGPPLYALALLVLIMVTWTQGTNAAQFMYRAF